MTADAHRRMRTTTIALVSLAIAIAIAAVAATGDEAGPPAHRVVLTDIAERTRYLPNPGMGWQDMNRRRPRLPQTVEYLRPTGGWAGLNPAPGRYRWRIIDRALAAADRRGHVLGLRIYTMRHPRLGGHRIPAWVRRAGARVVNGEPDYSNAVYQSRWARFVEALRRRYDGDPRLAFIDISGYGNYNEWSWQDQTRWERHPARPTTLDGHARRRLVDLFIGGSGRAKVRTRRGGTATVRYRYVGFQHTQLLMPYAGVRQSLWYALSRRADVGWRHDCLGRITAADVRRLGAVALRRWRTAPVVYEFCSTVDWSRVGPVVRATHPVLVRDNATIGPRVRSLLSDIGYRYTLRRADWPSVADVGGPLMVRMTWRNVGTTRAYPALGVMPRLRLRLLDTDGRVVRTWTMRTAVTRWGPGATTPVTAQVQIPRTVPPGRYRLAVAIVNTTTGRPLTLAMRGAPQRGWFPLGALILGGGG